MSAPDENEDAMTASFTASTFDPEVADPWTATSQGVSPVDLSTILCKLLLQTMSSVTFLTAWAAF